MSYNSPRKNIFKNMMTKRQKILWISAIFFIFFLLRLYRLGYHDFWYDEMATVHYAQYPWANWNAPLYWIVLYFWIAIFGCSEFSVRFPSLVFSFLSAIIVFFLGKSLFNKKAGIFAAMLIGLSPFHLWYAQEARDYSMVLFLGLLSSWLIYNIVNKNKKNLWLYFTLVSIAGFYTNYFYAFLLLAQFLYVISIRKIKLDFKAVICFLAVICGFSLYLPRFYRKFFYVWGGFWIPEPQWKSLIITLENFILGYNGTAFLYVISNILAGLLLILAIITAYRHKELRRNFIYCLFLFFIPVIGIFLFSKVFFSIYLDRAMIIFSPFFYLLLSSGTACLNKIATLVFSVALAALLLTGNYSYFRNRVSVPLEHRTGTYAKKPIRPAAEFLLDSLASEDIIVFTNVSVMPSLQFYSQDRLPVFYYFFDPALPDTSWQRPVQESEYYVPFHKASSLKFKRLWVIYSSWERDQSMDENSQSVKNWLDENFKTEFSKEIDGMWIFRYVKK
jgi:hypothetical protein